jgi:hypothetical protein
MRIKVGRAVLFTIKTKTLKKVIDKRLAEVVEKLNINPELIDEDKTQNAFRDYNKIIDILRKVEALGRTKLYVADSHYPFFSMSIDVLIDTPLHVLYYANVFNKRWYFELDKSQEPFKTKRLPKYFIKLFEFSRYFSPLRNREAFLFFAVPNKVPKIPINFLPIFKDGKAVFVRKDQLDKIEKKETFNPESESGMFEIYDPSEEK